MNASRPANANKMTWFILFVAMVASEGAYGLLCFLILQNPGMRTISSNLPKFKPVTSFLAVVALIAAVVWLRLKVDGRIGGEGRPVQLSAGQFQSETLVALSLTQACSVFGLFLFFLGAPINEFVIFAFGTVFVDLAFILPRGLKFWSTKK